MGWVISCWVIENDVDQRASIVAAVRHALLPEVEIGNLVEYDDIDQAVVTRLTRRVPSRAPVARNPPDLVLADLFRRDRHDLSPQQIAEIIATKRVARLEELRKQIGRDPVLVVISQYVEYFLRELAGKEEADLAITRIQDALLSSAAQVTSIIDKFSPAGMNSGLAEVKRLLMELIPPS